MVENDFISIRQVEDKNIFRDKLVSAVLSQKKYGACVDVKDSYCDYNCYEVNDGLYLFAIKNDGDFVSWCCNKDVAQSYSTIEKDIIKFSCMFFAIENGARKLDCYGIYLTSLYMQYGFLPIGKVKFDRDYNEDFPQELGEPDVYALFLPDNNVNRIFANIKANNFIQLDSCISKIKTYSDYDCLIDERDRILDNNLLNYKQFIDEFYNNQKDEDMEIL